MSDNAPSTPAAMQFEKAEYAAAQPSGPACSACKTPITQVYYTANTAVLCERCRSQIAAFLQGGSKWKRAAAASALGLGAGVAGAVLWYVVRVVTGYQLGLIGVLVGLMVGIAVRKGAKGRGGWFYQTLAMLLTYSCISAQYLPDIVQAVVQQAGAEKSASPKSAPHQAQDGPRDKVPARGPAADADADQAQPADADAPPPSGFRLILLLAVFAIVAFIISLAVPVMSAASNPMGLLIIGFALYEAWKINKRPVLRIAGPFQLVPATAPGAPGG